MNVTILANLGPGDDKPDVVMEQVAAALATAGHEATILTVSHDVAELVDGLRKHKPDLVFDLGESFGDDILGGSMGVAGVLDLLQVPYTGGCPGEIFLQEDKALSKKLLAFEQIPYPDFATFSPDADFETGGNLRMPLFVKPLRMEASIGIDERSLVRNTQQFKVSLDAYRALRVRDYGRIDLRLTGTGEHFVIEVNANCYLEQRSEFALAAAAQGIDLPR